MIVITCLWLGCRISAYFSSTIIFDVHVHGTWLKLEHQKQRNIFMKCLTHVGDACNLLVLYFLFFWSSCIAIIIYWLGVFMEKDLSAKQLSRLSARPLEVFSLASKLLHIISIYLFPFSLYQVDRYCDELISPYFALFKLKRFWIKVQNDLMLKFPMV